LITDGLVQLERCGVCSVRCSLCGSSAAWLCLKTSCIGRPYTLADSTNAPSSAVPIRPRWILRAKTSRICYCIIL